MNEKELQQAQAEELAAKIIGEKVIAVEELIAMQSKSLGCYDYQNGLYNGLVLAKSVLTGEEPQFWPEEGSEKNG